MNIRQTTVSVAAAALLCLALCFPSWAAATEAAQDEGAPKQSEIESEKLKQLEQRVKELEDAEAAREAATRSIIRDAMATVGSKINEAVSLGGTLEVLFGAAQVFEGQSARVLRLATAKLDFGIQFNDWTMGSLVIEYDNGLNTLYLTSEGFEEPVDRINLDQAFITVGDIQKLPPFLTAGRMVVPFGVSTGNPVADTPTIDDPLTIEVFETKEEAILFGVGFPTPPLSPATPPVTPPPVRPLVLNPFFSSISRALGYKPLPPPPLTPIIPTPQPPLFTGGIYLYNGDTYRQFTQDWRPGENYGATMGFRTKGTCGRSLDQLGWNAFCPWAIDIDVDYNNSVFDSLFLEYEYQAFLRQIGFVEGMAASVKATLGPVGLIAEWNGAINYAKFSDDLGTSVNIRPSAWQLSLTYQFDWNPWVEMIGAQGNYIAIGYSESNDLAGVTRVINGVRSRVGAVPKRRLLLSVGEWVLDGVRVALEFNHSVDYPVEEGGTGRSAAGIFSSLTYEW
jgi:hypothetical protein